ncbi:MAG: tetratricopeptide repeat protein [Bryobacteraceae bacterium]
MRLLAAVILVLSFVACSRDPNVVKRRYLENGNKYFSRGKYKEASIMYRNALQKDMRFGEAHYRLGLSELKLARLPSAVSSLRRAVELMKPDREEHWDASIRLAEIYLGATRDKQFLEEAEGITKRLLQRDPNSYDGHRLSGDVAFVQAQQKFSTAENDPARALLGGAIAEYRRADALKPNQPNLRMALARALALDRQFAEAEKIYRDVISKDNSLAVAYTELYQLYLYQNKLNEAEQVLKDAIAVNPKRYGMMALLASHYYGTRRTADMVAVLQRLKSNAKEFPQAYTMAGDFYLRIGDGEEAIRQYREGIAKDDARRLEYQKRIIEVLMRQGKKEEAARLNAEILKERPKDSDARGLEASLLLDRGDVSRAIAELQGVVNQAPENFVARFNLGRAHMARGEFEQARQQYTRAIELRPDYILARLALAQLQVARGEFEGALKSVAEILKIDTNNTHARLIESAALIGMRRFADSRQVIQGMLAGTPSSPDVMFQLGVLNLAENKYKEAEDAFRRAYQLNPANSRGLMGVVETYMAQNKTDEALQILHVEAARSPGRSELHLALGNTAARAGKYDMALSEFQTVLNGTDQKSRTAADLHLRIGEVHRRKGDMNASIASLQKARELWPENPTVVSTLALVLDAAGRKPEARTAYEQTLKLDPANAVAMNNLAFLMADAGTDLDQALTYAQRAKQLLPNLHEVSDTLGWIYLKKNLSEDAIKVFSDLVSKEPNHSTYRYHLGMALTQKGDKERARKELEQALRSNPPKDEAFKIRELMAKIG